MRIPKMLASCLTIVTTMFASAAGQTWTQVSHVAPLQASTPLLLTDGRVMVQALASSSWMVLTPDITGSYVNGTWSELASLPAGYAPEYYASAVLSDGRVVVEGGEYNGGTQDWTTMGAIYDPTANSWTSISPPGFFGGCCGFQQTIGDAPGVVLGDGTFMLGNSRTEQAALLDAVNLTWNPTGSGKQDSNNEEGWTLLPNGNVLTIDVGDTPKYELYNPSTQQWSPAGNVPVSLVNTACSEIGPAVLRPDGTVFATGGTSNTAVYSTSTGTWAVGPTFPNGEGITDGPAALLPDGNVLVEAAFVTPGPCYQTGTYWYEFNGTSLVSVPPSPSAGGEKTFYGRLLVLPTGQVLYTNQSETLYIYTPAGTYNGTWQPTISSVATTLQGGSSNNPISGTQFNGFSQSSMYGDDAQMATNYPLVRIKNNSTGHVFYCKTHNHSTMAVATGSSTVSTEFDIPWNTEPGPSTLVVVANGIPSNPVNVTIEPILCSQSVSCSIPVGFTVKAAITLSCREPDRIAVSAQACLAVGGGCSGISTNFGFGESINTSATISGPHAGEGYTCNFTYTYNGTEYSEQCNEQVCH